MPSASVPPSTGKPGLWRRKSGTGAVDAQGNLLVHPMVRSPCNYVSLCLINILQTWLDERLFGWSQSSKRETSAWGGFSSQEASRLPTPETSDREDEGDYDNVLGCLPTESDGSPSHSRPRSLRSSYADLQQLKLSNSLGSAPGSSWRSL